jgi:hypothetical protein
MGLRAGERQRAALAALGRSRAVLAVAWGRPRLVYL